MKQGYACPTLRAQIDGTLYCSVQVCFAYFLVCLVLSLFCFMESGSSWWYQAGTLQLAGSLFCAIDGVSLNLELLLRSSLSRDLVCVRGLKHGILFIARFDFV